MQTIKRTGITGKEIRITPPFHVGASMELGLAQSRTRKVIPSAGFLGIYHALANCIRMGCEIMRFKLGRREAA
ncbi:hypothetical protein GFPCMMHI_02966 [Ensifer adhaerens]|nr:hypothetical protein [Ensifer adhaerens]